MDSAPETTSSTTTSAMPSTPMAIPVVELRAGTDEVAIAALAAAAGAVAAAHDVAAEVAALAVRLAATDARRRTTVDASGAHLELSVGLAGTELVVALTDTGEPVTGPAAELLALVDLGMVSGVDGGSEGSGNRTVVRLALPAHDRLLDDTGLEVVPEDAPASDAEVVLRPLEAEDGPALTRCIYRCYGWTYPGVDLYYPDRIASAIASGRRLGEVAVTAEGEVAAHWGAVVVADGVVETGGTVTDPRFRGRGLANQLGERLLARLGATGVHGRMREPVLTHAATQRIALREGATMVGLYLHAAAPLAQVGITDGLLDERVSVTVMYSPLQPLAPATVWIPAVYEPFVQRVIDSAPWSRELGGVQRSPSVPASSVLSSAYDSLNRAGEITVSEVGSDLVDAVDEILGQLRQAGAEAVRVLLPANQQAFATVGAGLGTLGLGFAAFLPEFGVLGDTIALQWLADTEVDDSRWEYADEDVAGFAAMVIGQVRGLNDQEVRRRRREAQRQQLLAALPTDD